MSCYSVPRRLLHILFGGSAIWLGAAFCSPLAAIDTSTPHPSASAPDAVDAPDQSAYESMIPAAHLDSDTTDHWDTGPVVEDGPCVQEYACDDEYCDEYAYDGFVSDRYEEDAAQEETCVAETDAADGLVDVPEESVYSNLEDRDSYEFDDYEMYYGYEDGDAEPADEAATADQEIADEMSESQESSWEDYDYDYEDEYLDESEYSGASQPLADQATTDETDVEEDWADNYDDYEDNDYCYEYDDYESYEDFDMDGADRTDEVGLAAEKAMDSVDESYDYADPMDYFGREYDSPYEWQEMELEEPTDSNPNLFDWQPTELLDEADCDLVRSLERLSGEPSAVRRHCLNEYIEALGFRAIDFAYRYEDSADVDVLTLAGDLPGVAAFLAAYRLVEQERIGMDDAVVLLEGALGGLSLEWIEGVADIVAVEAEQPAAHPVVGAMAAAATRSIAGLSAMAVAVQERLAQLPWAEISDRLGEARSACLSPESQDGITF